MILRRVVLFYLLWIVLGPLVSAVGQVGMYGDPGPCFTIPNNGTCVSPIPNTDWLGKYNKTACIITWAAVDIIPPDFSGAPDAYDFGSRFQLGTQWEFSCPEGNYSPPSSYTMVFYLPGPTDPGLPCEETSTFFLEPVTAAWPTDICAHGAFTIPGPFLDECGLNVFLTPFREGGALPPDTFELLQKNYGTRSELFMRMWWLPPGSQNPVWSQWTRIAVAQMVSFGPGTCQQCGAVNLGCCTFGTTKVETTQFECQNLGGSWVGGVPCSPSGTGDPPGGGGTGSGGAPGGPGDNMGPGDNNDPDDPSNPPPTPQVGACCLPDGTCVMSLAADCAGVWYGPNSQCAQTDCDDPAPPQEGACCFDQGGCIMVGSAQDCIAAGGRWMGAGTQCIPGGPGSLNQCPSVINPGMDECCAAIVQHLEYIRREISNWRLEDFPVFKAELFEWLDFIEQDTSEMEAHLDQIREAIVAQMVQDQEFEDHEFDGELGLKNEDLDNIKSVIFGEQTTFTYLNFGEDGGGVTAPEIVVPGSWSSVLAQAGLPFAVNATTTVDLAPFAPLRPILHGLWIAWLSCLAMERIWSELRKQ